MTADFLWTSTYYDSHVGWALVHLLWVLRRIPRGWDILAVRVFVWNLKKASRTLIDVWIVNYMYQEKMTRNMVLLNFCVFAVLVTMVSELHVRELVLSGTRFDDITEKHITGLTSQLLIYSIKMTYSSCPFKEHSHDLRTRSHYYLLSVAPFFYAEFQNKICTPLFSRVKTLFF